MPLPPSSSPLPSACRNSCTAAAPRSIPAWTISLSNDRSASSALSRAASFALVAALRSRLTCMSSLSCIISISKADCFSTTSANVSSTGLAADSKARRRVDDSSSTFSRACCTASTWRCTESRPASVALSSRCSSCSMRDSIFIKLRW